MTNDELRDERVGVMGEKLGNFYHDLENELAWLMRKHRELGELFAEDDAQIALLNRVASNFFFFLKRMYFEDALLHIARLTDPAETGGRVRQANLTIQALQFVVTDATLQTRVRRAVDAALGASHFARDWRNKRLAHADLVLYRQGSASGLPDVRQQDIAKAAAAIAEPLKLVADHFGVPVALLGLGDPWGARALVEYLRRVDGAA
ncbi:MAG: hypothetical protein KJ066_00080 [Acidobacteria bacterium]|nr:hypothetical protein [Acidobacteriota bacterium]